MDIGIGLPNAVRGVERDGIVEWSRRADQAGFPSLGTLDRIAYPNYESLISLAAAAAVTERIRLATDQIVAGAAKEAATIKEILSAFEQAGIDEVICFPASADPAQVELLAEAVL